MDKQVLKRVVFKIPQDSEVMVKLIKAIPSTWSSASMKLQAPQELISSGLVLATTGLNLGDGYSTSPTIVGPWDDKHQYRKDPDLFAIVAGQKPGFIEFGYAGEGMGLITFELAKCIAAHLVGKGYRGSLSFYSGCVLNLTQREEDDRIASCWIMLEPRHGRIVEGEKPKEYPPHITLEWKRCHLEEAVEPIIQVCRSLELRELESMASTAVAAH